MGGDDDTATGWSMADDGTDIVSSSMFLSTESNDMPLFRPSDDDMPLSWTNDDDADAGIVQGSSTDAADMVQSSVEPAAPPRVCILPVFTDSCCCDGLTGVISEGDNIDVNSILLFPQLDDVGDEWGTFFFTSDDDDDDDDLDRGSWWYITRPFNILGQSIWW